MKELRNQTGESESMQKGSHNIHRARGQREGVVLPDLLENKTVKRPCTYGVNIPEREIDNNYKPIRGAFQSLLNIQSPRTAQSMQNCVGQEPQLSGRPVSGIPPMGSLQQPHSRQLRYKDVRSPRGRCRNCSPAPLCLTSPCLTRLNVSLIIPWV